MKNLVELVELLEIDSNDPRLKFDSNFTIMPDDCNYTQRVVFGGKMMAHMDLTAANCATRFLRKSNTADSAVTHKANIVFHKPSHCGDIIFLEAKIIGVRDKAIVIDVKVYKEERQSDERTFIANGEFVFVAMNGSDFVHHNLVMT